MSNEEHDPEDVLRQFREAVNMNADELREWLDTPQSREVGWIHEGEDESVGHHAGREILALLSKAGDSAPDEAEVVRMRRVVGYVHRHLAQGPSGDVEHSRWRYSLMNWGHDPLRDDRGGAAHRTPGEAIEAGAASPPSRASAAAKRPVARRSASREAPARRPAAAATRRTASKRAAGKVEAPASAPKRKGAAERASGDRGTSSHAAAEPRRVVAAKKPAARARPVTGTAARTRAKDAAVSGTHSGTAAAKARTAGATGGSA